MQVEMMPATMLATLIQLFATYHSVLFLIMERNTGSILFSLDPAVETESTRPFDKLRAPSPSRGSRSRLPGVEASTAESGFMGRVMKPKA
jgi:hypothetical protein